MSWIDANELWMCGACMSISHTEGLKLSQKSVFAVLLYNTWIAPAIHH